MRRASAPSAARARRGQRFRDRRSRRAATELRRDPARARVGARVRAGLHGLTQGSARLRLPDGGPGGRGEGFPKAWAHDRLGGASPPSRRTRPGRRDAGRAVLRARGARISACGAGSSRSCTNRTSRASAPGAGSRAPSRSPAGGLRSRRRRIPRHGRNRGTRGDRGASFVQFEHGLAGFEVAAREQAGLLELRQHAIDGGQPMSSCSLSRFR